MCALFNELGFNLTTAINAFVRQVLRDRAMPFYIVADAPLHGRDALRDVLKRAQEQSVINGTSEMTMKEIDAEISACRREKRG